VDASSGNVPAVANVRVRKVDSFTYFYRKPQEREVGWTDSNGLIIVPKINAKHEINFGAVGYLGAVAALTDNGKVRVTWPVPAPMTPWIAPHQLVTNIHSIIVIPMVPIFNKE